MKLASLFQDQLVLVRDRENPIWGSDDPGQRITLSVRGPVSAEASVEAGPDGRFELVCPKLPAGGPYELTLRGSVTVVVRDVLVGEVWLACGQSNMEWKVALAKDPDTEIANANFPRIRVLEVARRPAGAPQAHFDGNWRAASSETAASFTAVGFFFARELHQRLGVPIGIIDATWGGTSIDSWLSLEAARSVDGSADARLAQLAREEAEGDALRAAFEERHRAWERASFPADPPNTGFERGFAQRDFDDSAWGTLPLPSFWQHHGLAFNGVVWFRREFELPAELEGATLELSLGAVDDFDHTYVNGVLVGSMPDGTFDAFQTPRRYTVPASVLKQGKNVIAVRVFDHFGEGGFAGPSSSMYLRGKRAKDARIPLHGAWRYAVEHEIPLVPSSVFENCPAPPLSLARQHAPAHLHNGMLAPLSPATLSGVLFYQGESDIETHATYAARLRALIADLRRHFRREELPFLYVQLAGFRDTPKWPYLREAQGDALALPHTGMATAVDLGEADSIHPRDKQGVAHRLALIARALVYGEHALPHSGPVFEHAEFAGDTCRVSFRHAEGLRSRNPNGLRGFELAGEDGRYFPAEARIEGTSVLLRSSNVSLPIAARHAFSDYPALDLENAAGLPALPFRTPRS
jgi:sialate O-acetylesterase